MIKWPRYVKFGHNVGRMYNQHPNRESAEYAVEPGDWTFTAEWYYGSFYITAVDYYTEGEIAERLIGLELEEATEEEYKELGFVIQPMDPPTGEIFKNET